MIDHWWRQQDPNAFSGPLALVANADCAAGHQPYISLRKHKELLEQPYCGSRQIPNGVFTIFYAKYAQLARVAGLTRQSILSRYWTRVADDIRKYRNF